MPTDFELPPGGLGIRWPDPPLEAERRLHGPKMAAVAAFARANALRPHRARAARDRHQGALGIATTGKAYLDTRQALEDLGIDDARARRARHPPLQGRRDLAARRAEGARRFAEGLQDVLVVEEKRRTSRTSWCASSTPAGRRRPTVVGKARREPARVLLPSEGELTPDRVAMAIVAGRCAGSANRPSCASGWRASKPRSKRRRRRRPSVARTPFFCSGCPHNTSTKVPEGSRAMAGIGCHGMAMWMPERRTSRSRTWAAKAWAGSGRRRSPTANARVPEPGRRHLHHSGLLAIRAAAAAGVNITYKILYNDAVAMTGGQPADGG
jgi:indolepyruvate ferredoxin oxidoreductase